MPDPRFWSGDDTRDELTEPDPAPCESCGAAHDEPCDPGCQCSACKKRARQRLGSFKSVETLEARKAARTSPTEGRDE